MIHSRETRTRMYTYAHSRQLRSFLEMREIMIALWREII